MTEVGRGHAPLLRPHPPQDTQIRSSSYLIGAAKTSKGGGGGRGGTVLLTLTDKQEVKRCVSKQLLHKHTRDWVEKNPELVQRFGL